MIHLHSYNAIHHRPVAPAKCCDPDGWNFTERTARSVAKYHSPVAFLLLDVAPNVGDHLLLLATGPSAPVSPTRAASAPWPPSVVAASCTAIIAHQKQYTTNMAFFVAVRAITVDNVSAAPCLGNKWLSRRRFLPRPATCVRPVASSCKRRVRVCMCMRVRVYVCICMCMCVRVCVCVLCLGVCDVVWVILLIYHSGLILFAPYVTPHENAHAMRVHNNTWHTRARLWLCCAVVFVILIITYFYFFIFRIQR